MNEFGEVLENVSLKEYTTFKIGGICKYLIKVKDINSLSNLIKYLNENNIKFFLLGNGSNVILDDNYFDGVVIKFDNFNKLEFLDNNVIAGSGVILNKLVNFTFTNGFSDLYFLSMIPGSVGGSVVGNAGCYGDEILNHVESIKVMDYFGNIKILNINDINYGYRYSSLKEKYIVLEVTFKLTDKDVEEKKVLLKEKNMQRINSQPLEYPSVGSIFRNPEGYFAGKLIEDANLKGYRLGGAIISPKHANFIVNTNNAKYSDVVNLINLVKKEIKKRNNIDLVVEPSIIKWDEL